MTATMIQKKSVDLTPEESDALKTVNIPRNSKVAFKTEDGSVVTLPSEVQDAVHRTLLSLVANGEVAVARMPDELSSSTAADILGVSRPTLMKWAKEGKIPSFKVGTHTRFRRDEVLELRRLRAKKRSDAFDELREFELANFGPL